MAIGGERGKGKGEGRAKRTIRMKNRRLKYHLRRQVRIFRREGQMRSVKTTC